MNEILIDPALVSEVMQGAIDTHVHTMPAHYTPGKMDDLELAKDAAKAGMAGYVSKSAEMATVAHTMLATKMVPGIRVYSSIVLNSAVGGINPEAVRVALALGARVVWLPTNSAETHCGRPGARSPVVPVIDGAGHLVPELYEVMDLVKQANAILATGDVSAENARKVAQEARARGLQKVVITHPETGIVSMPLEYQTELARLGCYIEHCYASWSNDRDVTAATVAHNIRTAGTSASMLATDYGKAHLPTPVEGLRAAIASMLAEGFSTGELKQMVRNNSQSLLAD
jgi:hypothetical protein